jgi:hypothetical protein
MWNDAVSLVNLLIISLYLRCNRIWPGWAHNMAIMRKALAMLLIACSFLSGCKKFSSPGSTAAAALPNDAVQQKLSEMAGSGATNCGRLQSQGTAEMTAASKCAMDAAQQRHPFYVGYDMPGMTVGVAGNSEGKLFTLQSQAGGAGLVSTPCPAELRVASSGRLTCYAPGTFPMGVGMGSHGGMPSMTPAMGANPHPGATASTQPNPHQKQN